MSENIVEECIFLFESLLTGVVMAFAYDLIRLFRSLIHHNSFLVNIEDLLYWIMSFFMAFAMLYYENNGVIRLAAVFGAAVGIILYSVSVGKIFVKYMSLVIKKIIFWILKPILYVGKGIKKLIYRLSLFYKYRLTVRVNKHTINSSDETKKAFLSSSRRKL